VPSTSKATSAKKAPAKKAPAKPGPWANVYGEPVFGRPPSAGQPGNVPAGGNLSLRIGWERFEHLMVFVAQAAMGLAALRFRRYGTRGQAQQGIDLAGRRADGTYVVVQCKEYQTYTAASLRSAVKAFTAGDRPFDATHFVVAISGSEHTTQLEDELDALRSAHRELTLDLWGEEHINDLLRERNDIVSRFWTRETADTFCTAAPLAGVAAPPPNWLRLSDSIMLGPTGVPELAVRVDEAESLISIEPQTAAQRFAEIAEAVAAEGFPGHAVAMRRKQLDALSDAGLVSEAIELSAVLAAQALHSGSNDDAQTFIHQIELLSQVTLGSDDDESASATTTEGQSPQARSDRSDERGAVHIRLLRAALAACQHPLGEKDDLLVALRGIEDPVALAYFPLMVVLLVELHGGDQIWQTAGPEIDVTEPGAAPQLSDLVTTALKHPEARSAHDRAELSLVDRLRLAEARYDSSTRVVMLNEARMLTLTRASAALHLAAEARRNVQSGEPAEALMNWRQATQHAIHEGLTDDASGWLYSVRWTRARYGPLNDINLEHYLAQGLPKSGVSSALRRRRSHETRSYREAYNGKPFVAVNATRRWLADSIVLGNWADENDAVELLGDLLAANGEPSHAALCYQWVAANKKLETLASNVGDVPLATRSITTGPWWTRSAAARLLVAQEDLLEDAAASTHLKRLIEAARKARLGEVADGPEGELMLQLLKSACLLAGRGTVDDAKSVLELTATDVEREPNHYHFHDKEHVAACIGILEHHPGIAELALDRLLSLAEAGTHEALGALTDDRVLSALSAPDSRERDDDLAFLYERLSRRQRGRMLARIVAMVDAGNYRASVAACALSLRTPRTEDLAALAVKRLTDHARPNPGVVTMWSNLVPDSYLVVQLAPDRAADCLTRLMEMAEDREESAGNRASALVAARNIVRHVGTEQRADTFERAQTFAAGSQDGSRFDPVLTNPHPLSSFRVDMGPSTLRGPGLRLAAVAADSAVERNRAARSALVALRDDDDSVVHDAAHALNVIGPNIDAPPDPALLATHRNVFVRMLATVFAVATPVASAFVLDALASDADHRVRRGLARELARRARRSATERDDAGNSAADDETVERILGRLADDPRHSVRLVASRR
jgi:hypothetical protein